MQENGAPNKPLQFRLDKLQREHPYLTQERGLTLETIVDFGIGYCAKGMMAERIAIPIHNPEGQVVAYAGRFVGEPHLRRASTRFSSRFDGRGRTTHLDPNGNSYPLPRFLSLEICCSRRRFNSLSRN